MPGHRDIVVDTSDLAERLNDVRDEVRETTHAVEGTNTSVNTMTATVCAAEAAAAESVNRNVTAGFRNLIGMQLAQRRIESFSEVQAKCLLLNSFNDMLAHLNKQLQGDYERITKRYSKILQTLADSLKARIYNLDAPAAQIADLGYQGIINRVLTGAAPVVQLDQDVQPLGNMVVMARCKEDCRKSMEVLKSMVLDIRQLRNDLEQSVRNVPLNSSCRRALPMIVMESEDLNVPDFQKTDIQLGDSEEQKRILKPVKESYERKAKAFQWQNGDKAGKTISSKILEIASRENIDDRTRQVIQNLVDHASWQSLEAIQ